MTARGHGKRSSIHPTSWQYSECTGRPKLMFTKRSCKGSLLDGSRTTRHTDRPVYFCYITLSRFFIKNSTNSLQFQHTSFLKTFNPYRFDKSGVFLLQLITQIKFSYRERQCSLYPFQSNMQFEIAFQCHKKKQLRIESFQIKSFLVETSLLKKKKKKRWKYPEFYKNPKIF